MAWAKVQSNTSTDGSGTAAATKAVTLSSAVTSGNLVAIYVTCDNGVTPTVTIDDDKGNTYAIVDNVNQATDNQKLVSAWKANITNGPITFTAHFSPNASFSVITVTEFSGGGAATLEGNHMQSQSATTNPSSANTASLTAGDLLFGGVIVSNGGSVTFTAGTGFTIDQNHGAFTAVPIATEYNLSGGSGAQAATFNEATTKDFVTGILAFKAAGAAQPYGFDTNETQQRSGAGFALLAQHHWKEPDEFLRQISAVTPAEWGRYYEREQFPKREWIKNRPPPPRDPEFLVQISAVTPAQIGFDPPPQFSSRGWALRPRPPQDWAYVANISAVTPGQIGFDPPPQFPSRGWAERPKPPQDWAYVKSTSAVTPAQMGFEPPPQRPALIFPTRTEVDEPAYVQAQAAAVVVFSPDIEQLAHRPLIARPPQPEPVYPQVVAVVTGAVVGDEEQFPARLTIVRRAQDEPAYAVVRVVVVGDPEQFAHRFFRQISQQQESLAFVPRTPVIVGDVEQFPRRVHRARAQLDSTVDVRAAAPAALGPIGFDQAVQFPVRFEFIQKKQDEPGYQIVQITPPVSPTNPWVGFIGNTGRMMIRRG